MQVGRCSNIRRICAYGGPVQASYPATIKLTHYSSPVSPSVDIASAPNASVFALPPTCAGEFFATKFAQIRVTLNLGKVNAVRAAFKAGVTPSKIAKEFGISQADVRKVIASEGLKR